MTAIEGEPPAVARQRVRRALRSARRATSLSQGAVARRLGWSLSKMQRIEGGEVGVSATDLKALLDVYGVDDPEMIEQLTEDTRISRRQRYAIAPEYREHLTPGTRALIQFESEAIAIRAYQPVVYPGLLQTAAVAESILAWWQTTLSEQDRRIRFEVRMQRSRHVFERTDGPEYLLLLDESVIKRRIGSPAVTAAQLDALAAAAARPRVHIRIVPFAHGSYVLSLGPFQILDLSDDADDAVLYREVYDRDDLTHDQDQVKFHRNAFESLWAVSLSEDETLAAITHEAAEIRSSLDESAATGSPFDAEP